MVATVWKDKRMVHYLSSAHTPDWAPYAHSADPPTIPLSAEFLALDCTSFHSLKKYSAEEKKKKKKKKRPLVLGECTWLRLADIKTVVIAKVGGGALCVVFTQRTENASA